MSRFEGARMLVTGGTSGMGLATAERLLQEGAQVVVTGRNPERLAKAAKTFGASRVLANDAGNAEEVTDLAKAVQTELGGLDGAFLNAGYVLIKPLGQITASDISHQFAVNFGGPLLQAQALAPLLVDGGSIVLNTSVAQNKGMDGMSVYAPTKGAIRTLTRVLASELAPRSIRVNAVSPGPIDTNIFSSLELPPEQIEQFVQQLTAQVPLKRFGKPSEVAAAVLFLLSSEASYITGAELPVDGGMGQV